MVFNTHPNLEGKHAFLSASKYSWLNYDRDKLERSYENYLAIQNGTEIHELAKMLIRKGIVLPNEPKTLNMYVNDAIGYRMTPEVVLYYSDNCFGTADAICCYRSKLRIHDLKTGSTPASMNQLKIYAALFCSEYHKKPHALVTELRIYQGNDVTIEQANPEEIQSIIQKMSEFDKSLEKLKRREL